MDRNKCVIIFGFKKKVLPKKNIRQEEAKKVVKEVFNMVQEENSEIEEEIEEIHRLGKYEEGGMHPLKVKFRSQATAQDIIFKAWKLAKIYSYKKIWLRIDMTEKERARLNELIKKVKEKNEMRTEEEKQKFYWRVLDLKVKKWSIQEKD